MKQNLFLVLTILLLTACAANPAAGCVASGPALTPIVARPTATFDPLATATMARPLCPTATARPAPTARPTATAGAGLGEGSSRTRALTLSSESETLSGVFAGNKQGAVVYQQNGQLVVRQAGAWDNTALGVSERAALAFGVNSVAAVLINGSQLSLRQGTTVGDLAGAEALPLPWGGADAVAAYGADGWLYVAAGGQISKLNPFSLYWEGVGSYPGAAKQLTKLNSGGLLLLADDGRGLVYRRTPDSEMWALTWRGDQVPVQVDGSQRTARPDALAALGDRVALAWWVAQGAGGGGHFWYASESTDGGQTWQAAEQASAGFRGWHGEVTPLLLSDGTLEAAGIFLEPGGAFFADAADPQQDNPDAPPAAAPGLGFSFPMVARKAGAEWYPPSNAALPEGLTIRVTDLQPAQHFKCASASGISVCAWEARQYDGTTDIIALTR